jgi:hypothetical protein
MLETKSNICHYKEKKAIFLGKGGCSTKVILTIIFSEVGLTRIGHFIT